MTWDEAKDHVRVVDMRQPEIVGTCVGDADRVTKLVRVKWDGLTMSSLVYVGVLAKAKA